MLDKYNIPIVVIAHNRTHSLARILSSLNNATYNQEVRLIISIDKSDSNQVVELARKFEWKNGEKELIIHTSNLGLRNHVLACGDLTLQYDAVILLEDDLFVSPGFYNYTVQAIDFYKDDENISGISLYAHSYNETAMLPFVPIADDSDVFFMQLPSSWGQCWTKQHWVKFREWYGNNQNLELTAEMGLPPNVINWPDSSWKKYFYAFMIKKNKFFVYPRYSLSTNFGDPGVHFHMKLFFQQVPLLMGSRTFNLKKLSDSLAVYDSHCEILPDSINHFQPKFKDFDYTVDLYGFKTKKHITSKHILTVKKCSSSIYSFARDLKPIESNILNNIVGDDIFFSETNNCLQTNHSNILAESQLYYFFGLRDFQLRFERQKDLQASKNEPEMHSKLYAALEEKLTQKENLIKSIEQSYTFRIGKAILWPIKKISGRR